MQILISEAAEPGAGLTELLHSWRWSGGPPALSGELQRLSRPVVSRTFVLEPVKLQYPRAELDMVHGNMRSAAPRLASLLFWYKLRWNLVLMMLSLRSASENGYSGANG
jgi:hypothetical protein